MELHAGSKNVGNADFRKKTLAFRIKNECGFALKPGTGQDFYTGRIYPVFLQDLSCPV